MIYNLQLLRALAALAVVYLHVVSDAGLNLGIGVGNYGVDVFFVISGFTISYVGQMPAGAFMLRRVIRIVPLYWGATLGAYAVAWLVPGSLQSASADVRHLMYSLFFLPYPNKLGQLLPTLALGWTLNYEMYFYLLFGVALLFTIRWAPILASAFMALLAATVWLSGTTSEAVLFYAKPIIVEFALGILVYYLAQSERVKRLVLARPSQAKWVLIALGAVSAVALPLQELYQCERALGAGPPAFVLVLVVILLERQLHITVKQRWVIMLGDASYVLYLIHPYILYGLIRMLLDPSHMGTVSLALGVVLLPLAATLAAVAIHLVLERPVLTYLRDRLVKKPTTVRPMAAA